MTTQNNNNVNGTEDRHTVNAVKRIVSEEATSKGDVHTEQYNDSAGVPQVTLQTARAHKNTYVAIRVGINYDRAFIGDLEDVLAFLQNERQRWGEPDAVYSEEIELSEIVDAESEYNLLDKIE